MSPFNQMSRMTRRFGLPQAMLLTSAFITAVLIAMALRPARIAPADRPATISAPSPSVPVTPDAEREAAQAKLAAAMARYANPPAIEGEIPVQPETPVQMEAQEAPIAMAEPQPAPIAPPQAIPASPPNPSAPPLSGADLRRLNDKAAQALRDGDIYGARLVLERLVEGGDARALLALAETYDPKALARLNARGVKGDAARARALYALALEKGVTGARARLDQFDR